MLADPALCGYPAGNVQLFEEEWATRDAIRDGLDRLARGNERVSGALPQFA